MESDTRASMQTSLMRFLTWHWDLLWELHDEAVLPWSTIHKLRSNIWHLSMKLVVRLCVSTGFWGSLQSAIGTLLKLQLRWRRLESAAYNIFFTNQGVYLILITRTASKLELQTLDHRLGSSNVWIDGLVHQIQLMTYGNGMITTPLPIENPPTSHVGNP